MIPRKTSENSFSIFLVLYKKMKMKNGVIKCCTSICKKERIIVLGRTSLLDTFKRQNKSIYLQKEKDVLSPASFDLNVLI